jgi:ribonucleoside-triphosphate reductase
MDLSNEILSDITVHMKYARYDDKAKRREIWEEVVDRNKQMHFRKYPFVKDLIEEAYELVEQRKILPSMRSMQFGGKAIELNHARIYNCAYLPIDHPLAFSETMFLLLGGTGVGYSVQRHHVDALPEIRKASKNRRRRFVVQDSIIGWADAIKVLMKSYFTGSSWVDFDFSDIRPKGTPLKTAGGKAPGPEPLKKCIRNIKAILNEKEDGTQLEPIEVHDIVCHIADAVLAGGIRRAALISLFSADDQEMIACKYGNWWETNPQRGRANNSAVLLRHRVTKSFFLDLWKKIELSNSGEPGIYFTNDKDWGANPCVEIALRPNQFCNLVEINASDIETQEELELRARMAARIATLQAGYTDFHYLRPVWKRTTEKDALIGVSMTGIASGKVQDLDLKVANKVIKEENAIIAEKIGIKAAARRTCIKPAGTSSLVLGCSSGIHAWHNDYYIRRIRVLKDDALYQHLAAWHPELVEDDLLLPNTACIKVPQKAPMGATLRHETAMDLLTRVKYFAEKWIAPGHSRGNNSHNISATVSIKEDEWDEVGEWMWENRSFYNGLSVLPYDGGTYTQAPFEDCDQLTYERMAKSLHAVDLSRVIEIDDDTNLSGELACAGGACEIQ